MGYKEEREAKLHRLHQHLQLSVPDETRAEMTTSMAEHHYEIRRRKDFGQERPRLELLTVLDMFLRRGTGPRRGRLLLSLPRLRQAKRPKMIRQSMLQLSA